MYQQILSRKLIIFAFLFCIVTVFTGFLQSQRPSLAVCSSGNGLSLVYQHKLNTQVLHGQDESTILFCLGKVMPLYDRTIDYFSGSQAVQFSLQKRYTILRNTQPKHPIRSIVNRRLSGYSYKHHVIYAEMIQNPKFSVPGSSFEEVVLTSAKYKEKIPGITNLPPGEYIRL